MEALSYKCPGCASQLVWNEKDGNFKCKSCANTFTLEQLEAFYAEAAPDTGISWKEYTENSGSGTWTADENANEVTYKCESCGAEIITDANTAATQCAYCGNTAIMKDRVDTGFKPDYVIPFAISREEAVKKLSSYYNGKLLLPKEFRQKNHINEISGLYVPVWLYDCGAEASAVYDAKNIDTVTTGDWIITNTRHYRAVRAGTMNFVALPVDGSSRVDDAMMESIEPFDYRGLLPFSSGYLSGYLADKYDLDAKACSPRAEERIRSTAVSRLAQTVSGYSSVTNVGSSVSSVSNDTHYALLPVWFLNTRYKDKTYSFAMNAQTGKFTGNLPISGKRTAALAVGLTGGITAALYLLATLFNFFGMI